MSSPPFFSLNGSPSPKTSPAEAVPPAAGAARRGLFGHRQPLGGLAEFAQQAPRSRLALRFDEDDHPAGASSSGLPSAFNLTPATGLSLGQRRLSLLSGHEDPRVERAGSAAGRFFHVVRQCSRQELRRQAWTRLQQIGHEPAERAEPWATVSHEAIVTGVSRRLRQAGLFWCTSHEEQVTLIRDVLLVQAEAVIEQLQGLASPLVWAGAVEDLASRGEWESVDLAIAHTLQLADLRPAITRGARRQMSEATVLWLGARGWLPDAIRPQTDMLEGADASMSWPPLSRLVAEGLLGREGLRSCLQADPMLRLDQLLPDWHESLGTVAAERGWTELLAEFAGRMSNPQAHYNASWIRALARRDSGRALALFELGARATETAVGRQEALMGAVSVGTLEMVESLVEAGADPTALQPYDAMIEPHGLAHASATLPTPSRSGLMHQLCPLWLAARLGRLWMVRFFLERQPNLQLAGAEGEHLLTHACAAGDAAYLMELLGDRRIPLQVTGGRSVAIAIWAQPLGGVHQIRNLEVWRCFVDQWLEREQTALPAFCPITQQSVVEAMARTTLSQSADAIVAFQAAVDMLPEGSLDELSCANGLISLLEQLIRCRRQDLDPSATARLILRLFPKSPQMQEQVFEGLRFEDPFWKLILKLQLPGLLEALAAAGLDLYPSFGSALSAALEIGRYDWAQQMLRCRACPDSQAQTALRLLLDPPCRNRMSRVVDNPQTSQSLESRDVLLIKLLPHCSSIEGRTSTGQALSLAVWLALSCEERWSLLPELLQRCAPVQGDLHHGSLILQALCDASSPQQLQLVLEAIRLHPEWWDPQPLGAGLAEQLLTLGPVEVRRDPSRLGQLAQAFELWRLCRDESSRRQLLEKPLTGQLPLVHGIPAGASWLQTLISLGASIRGGATGGSPFLTALEQVEHTGTAARLIAAGSLDLSPVEAQRLLPATLRAGSVPALRRLREQGASLALLMHLCPLREALLHGHYEVALWICSGEHRREFGAAAYDLQVRLQQGERHPLFSSFPPINDLTLRMLEELAPTLTAREPSSGGTLLHAAVSTAPAWIPELLRLGLNPLQSDRFGTTAAHHALHRHLPQDVLLKLCTSDQILRTDGGNRSIALWACIYRRQGLLVAWLRELDDVSDRARVFSLAVAYQLTGVVRDSAAPSPDDTLWDTLSWLFAKGDRSTVIEVLQALERALEGWSTVTQASALERARSWVLSQPDVARYLLSCAPSLVPGLSSAELPPPACLALGPVPARERPTLELCHVATTTPADLSRAIWGVLGQLVEELGPATPVDLRTLLSDFRQRELISWGITLGFGTAEAWQVAVLPKLCLLLENLLLRARACRDPIPRAEAAHHLGLLLRVDPGWRWQLEQLRLSLPPLPSDSLDAHLSHAYLRARYAALEESLIDVFGELPRNGGSPSQAGRAALSGRQRSCFLDAYGVALGLLDEPWLWTGQSHCIATDLNGTDHRFAPLHGVPDPEHGIPSLLWTLSHRMESILLEGSPGLAVLRRGGHTLSAQLVRAALHHGLQTRPQALPEADEALERILGIWEPLASAWRPWIDWEQEGLRLGVHGTRMMRVLALPAFHHRLTPVCEEADDAVSLDDQIVNGSLRLLAPSSSETLRLHLHQGLALLRRMTEVMSPLYPQPESTLLQWLQQPYDHFYQIQTHALQKVARRLGSELGLESRRNPPFSESLAAYLFSVEELDQLLIDRGILKRMPVYAGLWGGS